MAHRIVTLPGDGIGPEILAPTLDVLRAVGDFEFDEHPFGGASIDLHGTALTDETLQACAGADAVLLAAVPMSKTGACGEPCPDASTSHHQALAGSVAMWLGTASMRSRIPWASSSASSASNSGAPPSAGSSRVGSTTS